MNIVTGMILGFITWFLVRYLVAGLFTVDQNERAVKTSFGRAERLGVATTLESPIAEGLQLIRYESAAGEWRTREGTAR